MAPADGYVVLDTETGALFSRNGSTVWPTSAGAKNAWNGCRIWSRTSAERPTFSQQSRFVVRPVRLIDMETGDYLT
jgi:hypothetical protein